MLADPWGTRVSNSAASPALRTPQPAGDDVEPFVALMHALVEPLWRVRVDRDDLFEGVGAAGIARQRDPGGAVAHDRARMDAGIPRGRGADEIVQGDVVSGGEWEEQVEGGAAQPGFQA